MSSFKKLIPLLNRIVVRKIQQQKKTASGILITKSDDIQHGVVLEVGPGQISDKGVRLPMSLQVGDRVLLPEYGGQGVKIDGQELFIYRDNQIVSKLDCIVIKECGMGLEEMLNGECKIYHSQDEGEQTKGQPGSMQPVISNDLIKEFIEQIRLMFKHTAPQAIIGATCQYLQLHHPPPMNNNFQPRHQDLSRMRRSPPFNPGLMPPMFQPYPPPPVYHQQKRRGRPPKNPPEHQVKHQNIQYQTPPVRVQQTREEKQRRFAQILIENGYGIAVAKSKVHFQFQLNYYYNSLRNILYKSFRKLEQKVQSQCKIQTKANQDYKLIKFKTELCTFQKWLHDDESQTFKQYIKSVYDLDPKPVSKGRTVRLYQNILDRWNKVKHLDGRYKEPTEIEKTF